MPGSGEMNSKEVDHLPCFGGRQESEATASNDRSSTKHALTSPCDRERCMQRRKYLKARASLVNQRANPSRLTPCFRTSRLLLKGWEGARAASLGRTAGLRHACSLHADVGTSLWWQTHDAKWSQRRLAHRHDGRGRVWRVKRKPRRFARDDDLVDGGGDKDEPVERAQVGRVRQVLLRPLVVDVGEEGRARELENETVACAQKDRHEGWKSKYRLHGSVRSRRWQCQQHAAVHYTQQLFGPKIHVRRSELSNSKGRRHKKNQLTNRQITPGRDMCCSEQVADKTWTAVYCGGDATALLYRRSVPHRGRDLVEVGQQLLPRGNSKLPRLRPDPRNERVHFGLVVLLHVSACEQRALRVADHVEAVCEVQVRLDGGRE
eukprot:6200384-Pleurochrysis_carterae.AAC.6